MTGGSAQRIVEDARRQEAAAPDGRLPVPSMAGWDTFPFEGDLRVKPVADAVLPEPPRNGVGGVDCYACSRPDSACVWSDDDWRLVATQEPTGLPVVLLLEPRAHHDLADLPDRLVDAMGRMVVRVERALREALGDVGRVQVLRVGDGAEHLHLWFLVRPEGFLQGRGGFLQLWDDVLPPRPVDEWRRSLAAVAAAMAARD